eukprot:1115409-Alexandrium_andersonii.AAC.1
MSESEAGGSSDALCLKGCACGRSQHWSATQSAPQSQSQPQSSVSHTPTHRCHTPYSDASRRSRSLESRLLAQHLRWLIVASCGLVCSELGRAMSSSHCQFGFVVGQTVSHTLYA